MKKLTTAKITGLLYLGLAITGALSYLYASQNLYVEGSAIETAANLATDESLARIGIAAELGVVAFQALAAVWFYKLFKKANQFSAGLITVFGMVNATILLVASAAWYGALQSALNGSVETALQFYDFHEYLWLVGALFFGLWLLPMGYSVMQTKMPKALGWVLIVGGTGYILSAFTSVLFSNQMTLAETLVLPASVGEFWMIGYLLFKKVQ